MRIFLQKILGMLKTKWGIAAVAAVVLGTGTWYLTHQSGTAYQFVTVTQGSITQTVSVTGTTAPMQSVSLAFQDSGIIARVLYPLGATVNAGDLIAQTATAGLDAALAQATANVRVQQAQLEGLQAGSQPQDIAASQASLAQAQQDLANLYGSINDSAASGYIKSNDAVHTELNPLFFSIQSSQPQLSFETNDSQAATTAQNLLVSANEELALWQQELADTTSTSSPDALMALLTSGLSHLAVIQNLLNVVSTTLDGSINLSAAQVATDKADVTAGLTEVNAAMSALDTISQNIASQKAVVAQAQAELALKQAGSTPSAIAAQQAQVAQAQAQVALAEANLSNTQIIAPISGVLTQEDAKVGQQAVAGTPLVSIIGASGFEVDAGVSDTDIGKLAIGDDVSMTLDAFPGDTFTGSVFYIAPAETNTNGVITYLIKVSLATTHVQLKSGLTANLNIATAHKDNVLILPQYAILENDQGTFVEVLAHKVVVQVPVTLGIQDDNGNVEVTSGVSDGEQVLNIGLKTP